MVLVWNIDPVLAWANPPIAGIPNLSAPTPPFTYVYQSYQAYSIIDPAEVPLGNIRYRNFLVPLGEYPTLSVPPPAPPPGTFAQNFFCAGHAASSFADLIVVGCTDWLGVQPNGGTLTYAFNPRLEPSWPNTNPRVPLYPGYSGHWTKGPDLDQKRWYATALLTHRLSRASGGVSLPRERMLVFGGSETVPASSTDASNITYEALIIDAESGYVQSNVRKDQAVGLLGGVSGLNYVWDGPSIAPGSAEIDWLLEYPRSHLLPNGRVLVSSYAPRWGTVDHDFAPGSWAQAPGQPFGTYSSNWQDIRHDGSSVLFPNLGGNAGVVVRLGGRNHAETDTTATMESLTGGSGDWQAAPEMENVSNADGGRFWMNTVILPTGALLVLGGTNVVQSASAPVFEPILFENGIWNKIAPNPTPSRREYHSTAVLLPDGRVFLGGGNDRDYDYEIFSPAYLDNNVWRPVNLAWQAPVPSVDPFMGADIFNYGQEYEIHCDPLPLGVTVEKAVLMAPCSVTHHSDQHQRYFEMKTRVTDGYRVRMSCPDDERLAPRGVYMLFLVTNTPAVSEAKWVVLR
jgi:hypothetical protein